MQGRFKKVVMVGLGYIGLPTATMIAKSGIYVHGVDVNPYVVETINKGKIHIVEPDLDGLLKSVVEKGLLTAGLKPIEADVFIIAVPTPFKENFQPDVSYVESATQLVIPYLKKGDLFILESTSPIMTTEKITDLIFQQRPELKNEIFIAYCPERVLPGNIIHELENNDRVIGGIDEISSQMACEFYCTFVKANLHKTNARTAEMCKLTENSSRDVQIAFANELSIICDKAGINVWELIELANKHPRVKILWPGTGVGGHCIAVDPWFIVSEFPDESKIIRTAREINNYKTQWVLEKIKNAILEFTLKNNHKPKVALMGLAFKPDIDDLRESPALEVVHSLINTDIAKFYVNEPNIESFEGVVLSETETCLSNADIIVYLTAHKQYKPIKPQTNIIELDFCGVRKK